MTNISFTSSPDFSNMVSEDSLVYEFGLFGVRCLLRGLDRTQRKDNQTDHNFQTTSRSNVVFKTTAEEKM